MKTEAVKGLGKDRLSESLSSQKPSGFILHVEVLETGFEDSASQFAERAGKVGRPVVRVEAARVRQDPDERARERLGLSAECGLRAIERRAERRDAHDSDRARPEPAHLAFEPPAACSKLLSLERRRRCRGARDEVGDPDAKRDERRVLPRREAPRREPGCVKRRPEPVSRPREVMAGCARIEAGIDATEQHVEIGRDHVADRLALRGEELRPRRPPVRQPTARCHEILNVKAEAVKSWIITIVDERSLQKPFFTSSVFTLNGLLTRGPGPRARPTRRINYS